MHITIERTALVTVLTRASQFSDARGTIPVLGYALFTATDSGLTSTATILEQQITDRAECQTEAAGSALIPVAQVLDIAKKLPREAVITIRTTDTRLTIKSGSYSSHVALVDTRDFPVMPETEYECSFTVDASVLRHSLERVSFAMSSEETRYFLCGVFIHTDGEKLKFCATDGHRLAVSRIVRPDITGEFDKGVIVPRKLVTDIVRLLDGAGEVTVRLSGNRIMFDLGFCRVEGKLIDGNFPEYQRVIPKTNGNIVTLPTRQFNDAVQRVSVVSKDRSKPVKIILDSGEMTITCDQDGNSAEDKISVEYEKDQLTIGFQARYISDVLSGFVGNSVWKFGDGSGSPAVVMDSGNEDILCVLMPVRV